MLPELCRHLGMTVPIIQAPMNWATDARLVAAVSAAGGLGTLGPNAGLRRPIRDPAAVSRHFADQIGRIRALTDRPFAFNVPIAKDTGEVFSDVMANVAIEQQVPVAIVVSGGPAVYTDRFKKAGIFVIHAVSSVLHARKAEAAGVDAVVAEAFEAGGHSGHAELSMSVLVPQIVDAVRIPVIAAGGIVDGRGLVMGLAAGAQAVYMGTRFMAAIESPIDDRVKAAIVAANDTATMSWGRQIGVARTLANAFTRHIRTLEVEGASPETLFGAINDYSAHVNRRVGGLIEGDLEQGEIYLGAGAGMIDRLASAADIIETTMAQARAIIAGLASLAETNGPTG